MPDWEAFVRRHLSLPEFHPDRERRIIRELAANLEDLYQEGLARGMSEAEAETGAAAQIPDWERFLIDVRGADPANMQPRLDRWLDRAENAPGRKGGRSHMFTGIAKDIVHGLRRLGKSPGYAATSILILALGIGANTAMFSVVDTFLFRPLPFARAHEVVRIFEDDDDGNPGTNSYPAYLDLAGLSDAFTGAAAVITGQTANWLPETGVPQPVAVAWVSSNYFRVIGLRPFLGGEFQHAQDQAGARAEAVVSYRMWAERFGSDPAIIGRIVKISGAPIAIVGIGPRGYGGMISGHSIDFWLSLSSLGPISGPYAAGTLQRRDDHWFDVIARLRPGISPAQAQAAVSVLAARLGQAYPVYHKGRNMTVLRANDVRLRPDMDRSLYSAGAVLMGVSGLVLLVACSNLANLVLARGSKRSHELALRLALGSTRWRLIRHLLVESILLGIVGGLFGLLFAGWSTRLLLAQKAALALPVNLFVEQDFRVLTFALGLSLATGVAFGLVPALRITRPELVAYIKDPEDYPTPCGAGSRRLGLSMRNLLVIAQVAGSLVLLVGTGLLIRSIRNAQQVDLGFHAAGQIAILQADAAEAGLDGIRAGTLFREFADRVGGLPGVEAVSWTTRLPMTLGPSSTLEIDEYRVRTGTPTAEVEWAYVAPNYFETLKLPLLHGRTFTEGDAAGTSRIAVVSEAMARRYWGKSDVVGIRYRHQGAPDSWVQIVGVVADVKVESVGEQPTPMFYRPLRPGGTTRLTVVARSEGNPAPTAMVMRQLFQEMNPGVPVYETGTMEAHLSRSLNLHRAAAGAVGLFGMIALLMAGIGLYGVVAFTVAQRTAEVGIRMALGARSQQVVRMLIREVMVLVGVGVALGLGLALLTTPVMRTLLFGVPAGDPMTFAAVLVLLTIVSLAATWMPARRAARIDPVEALRHR